MLSLHSPLIVPQIPALLPHSLPQEHPRLQRAARQQGLERLLQPPRTHLRGRQQAEARLQDKQERFAFDGQDNWEVILENQQQKSQQEICISQTVS